MIDIHSHVLPNVDDGSSSIEVSLSMLSKLSDLGVTDLILTPHKRGGFVKTKEELKDAFESFNKVKNEKGIPVNLYLGQEIYYSSEAFKQIKDKTVLTLNGTDYLLLEFSYYKPTDISECVYECKSLGYIPIVAHAERYVYLTVEDLHEIRSVGGLIQINADSVVGKTKRKYRKSVKRLLKLGLVDFVAGDEHSFREFNIRKAYLKIRKKYGEEFAERVFNLNAEKIIKG